MINRRSLFAGLGAIVAAPAIIKITSLMPINSGLISYSPLTTDMITRRAVELFAQSNAFLRKINEQYESNYAFINGDQWIEADGTGTLPKGARARIVAGYERKFSAEGAKIGSALRIRLPSDYVVLSGPAPLPLPELSAPEMATVGAAAVLAKNPVMSRRFWN